MSQRGTTAAGAKAVVKKAGGAAAKTSAKPSAKTAGRVVATLPAAKPPGAKSPAKSAAKRAPKTPATTVRTVVPGMVETALAAFAHEVRTPLTGILALSDLLTTSALGARERRWVETIKASAEHLSALATLFVDAARSGKAGLHLRKDVFDLRALAQTAGDSLAGRAAAKGLQASTAITAGLPDFVAGDPVRLRAALENLIDNAVKFTEQGSVDLTVDSKPRPAGRRLVSFALSDSGIGLNLAEIRRLFRRFSQANVRIASRFGGAGLGLASVKQLARAMGGDVAVAPRPGGGTTFTLTVLLDPVAPPAMSVDEARARRQPPPATAGLRLLSVEDNPFGRVVLNAILGELGHRTEFVGDGEAALLRIADGRFDAVLMDMVLPGISGVEAIRRIRALPKPAGTIAIIGVSGRDEDDRAAREAGADAFLLKPVSPRALATALDEATQGRAGAT